MNKSELITWMATLAEGDPRLNLIEQILQGNKPPEDREPPLNLKETAESIRRDPTWLHRLGIQKVGQPVTPGGRLQYRISEVKAYLASAECAAVRDELRRKRRQKERTKK